MFSVSRRMHAARWLLLLVLGAGAIWSGWVRRRTSHPEATVAGTTVPQSDVPAPPSETSEETRPQEALAEPTGEQPEEGQPEDSPPEPAVVCNELLKRIGECLQRDALDEARRNLAKLEDLQLEWTARQSEQLAAARAELQQRFSDRQLRAEVQRLGSPKREDVRAAQDPNNWGTAALCPSHPRQSFSQNHTRLFSRHQANM